MKRSVSNQVISNTSSLSKTSPNLFNVEFEKILQFSFSNGAFKQQFSAKLSMQYFAAMSKNVQRHI